MIISKADEMFEELGYEKIDEDYKILYIAVGIQRIEFNKIDKKINIIFPQNFTMQELEAINKKVEELGWL